MNASTTSEPASYTWTMTKSVAAGVLSAYRGAAAVETFGGRANAASASATAPSVTAATEGGLVVGFFGLATNVTVTPPTGMIEQAEANQNGGKTKLGIETSDSVVRAAGATGDRVATANNSAANVGQVVVIRP